MQKEFIFENFLGLDGVVVKLETGGQMAPDQGDDVRVNYPRLKSWASSPNDREQPGRLNATLDNFVQTIDWDLLREQKRDILALLDAPDITYRKSLTGILHLIDSLQDAVVDAKMKTEHEVFGTSTNQDEIAE